MVGVKKLRRFFANSGVPARRRSSPVFARETNRAVKRKRKSDIVGQFCIAARDPSRSADGMRLKQGNEMHSIRPEPQPSSNSGTLSVCSPLWRHFVRRAPGGRLLNISDRKVSFLKRRKALQKHFHNILLYFDGMKMAIECEINNIGRYRR